MLTTKSPFFLVKLTFLGNSRTMHFLIYQFLVFQIFQVAFFNFFFKFVNFHFSYFYLRLRNRFNKSETSLFSLNINSYGTILLCCFKMYHSLHHLYWAKPIDHGKTRDFFTNNICCIIRLFIYEYILSFQPRKYIIYYKDQKYRNFKFCMFCLFVCMNQNLLHSHRNI